MAEFAYIPRLTDPLVEGRLRIAGAVSIVGPKWCGKTTSAAHHAASQISMTDPAGDFAAKALAEIDPALALEGARPRLIDEWQEVPKLWDAVRYSVDGERGRGMYILTGSATPAKGSAPAHSGAGRISRVRMSTMTLQEMGLSSGKASLAGLFEGDVPSAVSHMGLKDIAEAIVHGGWPAALDLGASEASAIAADYIDAVCEADISRVDGVQRDSAKVRRLLRSLARNEASLATKKTIIADAVSADGGDGLARMTVDSYLKALDSIYFIADIPAWDPALKSPVRMRSAAKHHMADPSLAVAAIGASTDSLVRETKYLGSLFESLAVHDLMVYAQAMDAEVLHYHDVADLEVDAIVSRRDGAWAAVEIKLGAGAVDEAAENLNALERKMVAAGESAPKAKIVLAGVGAVARLRPDGVAVVPLDALGA